MSDERDLILLIDDEPDMLGSFSRILEASGHTVAISTEPTQIANLLSENRPALVITDLRMPGLDGMGVLSETHNFDPGIPVIVLTAYGSIESAVQAVKEGAFDYLTKPIDRNALIECVRRAIDHRHSKPSNGAVEGGGPFGNCGMLGQSEALAGVIRLLQRVAKTDANVLFTGESGTGKEVAARCLHAASHRHRKPFVPIDCASLPETLLESELFGHERGAFTGAVTLKPGIFELAEGGTILLDEIGEMSLALQAKLLRVVQERCFRRVGGRAEIHCDVRILSATNRDLAAASATGGFRQDLFFRLNVIAIELPPLRNRSGDIPILANHFLGSFLRGTEKQIDGISPEAMARLESFQWPGNVRELQNVVERAVVISDGPWIEPSDLPTSLGGDSVTPGTAIESGASSFHHAKQEIVDEFERDYLIEILKRHGGNISKASTEAGINRRTLYRLIDKFDIDITELRH